LSRRLPRLSGYELIEILVKKFGFRVSRRRGSHVVLVKFVEEMKRVTVVPLHKELKPGTLLGVLDLAGIDRDEFIRAYEEDC